MIAPNPRPKKLYIVETGHFGTSDVAGALITVDGEVLRSHVSSSADWLRTDLTKNFGQEAALAERFGEFEVVYVGLADEMPEEIAQHFDAPRKPDAEAERDASEEGRP